MAYVIIFIVASILTWIALSLYTDYQEYKLFMNGKKNIDNPENTETNDKEQK